MVKRVIVPEATQGNPADKICLVGFGSAEGACSSMSPFCAKVETVLRVAGLPYEVKTDGIMKLSPKKKFPVILHGDKVVTESSIITEYLANTYPEQMAALLPEDASRRATAHLVQRTLEEHFVWVLSYQNWTCDEFWADFSKKIFEGLPALLWMLVPGKARAKSVRDVEGQGMGLLALEDVLERGRKDLAAISSVLGNQEFLTGATPTEADCSLFGFLDYALHVSAPNSPVPALIAEFSKLMSFYERVKARYYGPDHPSKFIAH